MNKIYRSLWLAVGIFVLGFLTPVAAWEPSRTATCAADMSAELRKAYPVVAPVAFTNMVTSKLSGRFGRGSGLSGQYLYLFTDRTYVYSKWSDVMKETIFYKGTWGVTNGLIMLTSDKSLPETFGPPDQAYLPVGLSDSNDLFIMSHRRDFSKFTEKGGSDPAFMFRLCTLIRIKSSSGRKEKQLKARLLKKALREPGFYQ